MGGEQSDRAPAVGGTQGHFLESLMPSLKRMRRNLSSDEGGDSGKSQGE